MNQIPAPTKVVLCPSHEDDGAQFASGEGTRTSLNGFWDQATTMGAHEHDHQHHYAYGRGRACVDAGELIHSCCVETSCVSYQDLGPFWML